MIPQEKGDFWQFMGFDNMDSYFGLKVHKIENFFDSDFGICIISLLAMSKY